MAASRPVGPSDRSSSENTPPLRKRDLARQMLRGLFEKSPQSEETISRATTKAGEILSNSPKQGVRKSIKGILSKTASRASILFSKSVKAEQLQSKDEIPDEPLDVTGTKSPKTEKESPKEFRKLIKRNNSLINDLYQEVHRLRALGDQGSLAKADTLKETINNLGYENQVHYSRMKGIKPPTKEEYFAPPKPSSSRPPDEDDDYVVVS